MKVTAAEDMTISAVDKLETKAQKITFDDETSATFKVGETSVVLADGVMTITAKSEIKFDIRGTNKQGAKKSVQI